MKKLVFILILFPFIAFSQNQALIKANKKYNNFEYLEAIKIYESIAKKGNGTPEIFENLANAYYNNANYAAANKWFAKLNEVNPNMSAESQYRYVLTLKSVGNNQEAEKQLNLYQKANPSQIRSKLLKAYKETASRYQFSN
jgi:tetratricopeptide (TPR) repeat protein